MLLPEYHVRLIELHNKTRARSISNTTTESKVISIPSNKY
jgi:hypothetical protein